MERSRCFSTTGRTRFLATYSWIDFFSRPDMFWCVSAASALISFQVASSTFELILMLWMVWAWLTESEMSSRQDYEAVRVEIRRQSRWDFYRTRFCTVMHCYAIQATDAPLICIQNS